MSAIMSAKYCVSILLLLVSVLFLNRIAVAQTQSQIVDSYRNHRQYPSFCGLNPQAEIDHPFIPPLTGRDELSLVQVHGFNRHGDRFFSGRSTAQCWPGQEDVFYRCKFTENTVPGASHRTKTANDKFLFRKRYLKNSNQFKGTCGIGQLTEVGRDQMHVLGGIFKKAYVPKLISRNYDKNEVFFRSTDLTRTIMSMEAFAQGLYGSDKNECTKTKEQLLVDIHTMDEIFETMLPSASVCPDLRTQMYFATQTPAYQEASAGSLELYSRIANALGVPFDSSFNIEHISDCLGVSACHDWPMPDGVSLEMLKAIEDDFLFRYVSLLQYPDRVQGTRKAGGPLLLQIYERMLAAQNPTEAAATAKKLYVFTGHDVGPIILLLSAFNHTDQGWPPYASYIALEMYKNAETDQYFIRAIYNGHVFQIAGCESDTDGLCTFSKFQSVIEPMLPSKDECPQLFR